MGKSKSNSCKFLSNYDSHNYEMLTEHQQFLKEFNFFGIDIRVHVLNFHIAHITINKIHIGHCESNIVSTNSLVINMEVNCHLPDYIIHFIMKKNVEIFKEWKNSLNRR